MGVIGETRMMSISVARGNGQFGIQVMLVLGSLIGDVTAENGVTIRNAIVMPKAIGIGRGHFSMNLSCCVEIAPRTSVSNDA